MIEFAIVESPVGPLSVAARDGRTCLVHFGSDENAARKWIDRWYPLETIACANDPGGAVTVLNRYFAGELDVLDTLEVELKGTAFQQLVWEALRGVKAGQTASYGELANRIGAPTAVRAVGAANGANPVPIIVPCHRVIGSNGTLTGYGGGLPVKEWLLRHENVLLV
jgi:methylated-DNA-[protein]-cysteine S-methyltransferase